MNTGAVHVCVSVCGYSLVCVWHVCAHACCKCISLSNSYLDIAAQSMRGDPVTRAGRKRAMQSATHGSHTHARAHMHAFLSPPPNISLMRWISWMQQMCSVQSNALHLSVITHTHTTDDTQHMIDGSLLLCSACSCLHHIWLYILDKYLLLF